MFYKQDTDLSGVTYDQFVTKRVCFHPGESQMKGARMLVGIKETDLGVVQAF